MRTVILVLSVLFLSGCPPPTGQDAEEGRNFPSDDPEPDAAAQDRPMDLHRQDLTWLLENSPLVFLGRLSDRRTGQDRRELIVTHNHFEIEDVLIGDFPERRITLTTLGGALGDETLRVSHMPEFAEGQRYLIFTDPSRTTYNPITGNENGVFLVTEDSGVYTYAGISVAGIENGIVQLGGETIEGLFEQDPRGPVPLRENPQTEGEIVSAERTELPHRPAIRLEEFVRVLRALAQERNVR